jgi:hypothetical protein
MRPDLRTSLSGWLDGTFEVSCSEYLRLLAAALALDCRLD